MRALFSWEKRFQEKEMIAKALDLEIKNMLFMNKIPVRTASAFM